MKLDVGESILKITLVRKMKIKFAELVTYKVGSVKDPLSLSWIGQSNDDDTKLPQEIVMQSKDKKLSIGRDKDNTCRLKAGQVSSKHA